MIAYLIFLAKSGKKKHKISTALHIQTSNGSNEQEKATSNLTL